MLSRVQLKHKIFIGFLLVALFTLIVGGTNYFYLGKVIGKFDHVVKINMGNLDRLAEMRDSARTIRSRMYSLVGSIKGHDDEKALAFENMTKETQRFEKNNTAYKEIEFVDGEDEIYKKVEANWNAVNGKTTELVAIYKAEGSSEKFQQIFFNEYEKSTDELFASLTALMDFQHKEADKWSAMSADIAEYSSIVSVCLMIIGFVISVVLGTVLSRTITNQLTMAINELNKSAPELIQSATDLGSMSSELSSCSTEQAAAVQETASSLEEISAMIKRNSDHTENALASSSESLSSVKKGQNAVSNMIEAMNEINHNNESFSDFMKKNNDELREMVNVITNISEKTKVINDIVFQTKLLSFNASVEAARAGEQGKGFAVVAEEVGNLAQMSGNAANEIKGLLEESIVKVNDIVTNTKSQVEKLVHDGKIKIETGVDRAKDCDVALSEINENVSRVQSLVSEVSLASSEQSQGIGEVNKAMGQIDEVTNQNSVAAQKVADNASSVMQLSQNVKETSDKLSSLLFGAHADVKMLVENSQPKKKAVKAMDVPVSKLQPRPASKSESPAMVKSSPVAAPAKASKPMATAAVPAPAPAPAPKKEKLKVAFTEEEKISTVVPTRKKNEASVPSYDDKRFEDV